MKPIAISKPEHLHNAPIGSWLVDHSSSGFAMLTKGYEINRLFVDPNFILNYLHDHMPNGWYACHNFHYVMASSKGSVLIGVVDERVGLLINLKKQK